MRLENLPTGGVLATLDLPVRFAADPAPPDARAESLVPALPTLSN